MDLKIKSNEGNFKMRVACCIVKDGKLLTVKICENPFYCLPGGHVHLGESTLDAILRETKEEVRVDCKSTKLISVIEGFFKNGKGKLMHEVCYYYMVDVGVIETKDYTYVENDEGELKNLEFKWVKLEDLLKVDFRPSIIGKKLASKNFEFEHIIFNEL